MNNRIFIIIISCCVLLFSNCQSASSTTDKKKTKTTKEKKVAEKKIIVLPLGKINDVTVNNVYDSLQQIFSKVVLLKKEQMPAVANSTIKFKYQADSLIHWMNNRAKENEVYLGITSNDICHTKENNPTYGIMGLGYRPGKACVASDFRVKVKSNYFKIVIHELGHTAGLQHCLKPTCYMRDAEGHDPTGEEKEFCKRCKSFLIEKGWKL